MRAFHALMMMLGALAVLTIGALPANALTDASSAPPCHGTMTHDSGTETPAPGKATMAMDCCIACVAAPTLRAPERARVAAPRPTVDARPAALPAGERPAPELHPPRPTAL